MLPDYIPATIMSPGQNGVQTMKFLNLRGLMAALALFMGFAALATPQLAAAQTTNPTTPTTSCGNTACPGTSTWTIGGQSIFGGAGASVFEGTTGSNKVTKIGSGGVDVVMKATGCATIDCTSGASSFTFNGFAREQVNVETTAGGSTSGVPVMAQNQGQAIGIVNFTMQRLQGPTPTTAP